MDEGVESQWLLCTLTYHPPTDASMSERGVPISRKNHALPEDLQAKMIETLNRHLADAITDTMMQLPNVSLPEVDAEAMERWLDDGGASDN